jgi:transglutaminase-like putative cysteine protease
MGVNRFTSAVWGVSLLFLFSFQSYGQSKRPTAGKEPAWVKLTEIDYSDHSLDDQAEDGYIDVAYAKQHSVADQCTYYKKSVHILSEAGVQNMSQLSFSFDPAYEQLTLHTIWVIRDGKKQNRLQLSKVQVLHQEEDLKRFVYNGTLNAILILDDIAPDDIIEYSYSVKGSNPAFNGRYTDAITMRAGYPYYNYYIRVLVPESRTLNIKNFGDSIPAPAISHQGGQTVYEWQQTHLTGLEVETRLPSWYFPYPYISISEYKSWKEVSQWAMQLFPRNVALSAGLQQAIRQIEKENSTSEARVLAALHAVQDKIRYMGIEMGANSHRPANPNKVYEQRFGDCKEKSYLLCLMLQAMNIPADVVLINTDSKATLKNDLPASTAFNHATVRVKVGDRYYWFDPTISRQRGSIDDIEYPDYQCGLVVTDTTTGLTDIPFAGKGMVKVHEAFNAKVEGGEVGLTVTSTYTGSFADEVREEFQNNSNAEMKAEYRKFYQAYYDKIKADSISYEDIAATGTFVVKEYYRINSFWQKTATEDASVYAFVISSYIKRLKETNRTMPLRLVYPARYEETVEVRLPDDFNEREFSDAVRTDEFYYTVDATFQNHTLTLAYRYENLKDHVPAELVPDYAAKIEKADNMIGYSIAKSRQGSTLVEDSGSGSVTTQNSRTRTSIIYSILLILAIFAGMTWWSQRGRQ